MSNSTIHLLSQSAFWRLSKILVNSLGLVRAFILTDLIDKSEYLKSVGKLEEDGWFHYKREKMLSIYPIGETTLRRFLNDLKKEKLIDIRLQQQGLDRRNYFKVNDENIRFYINEALTKKSRKNGI